jgi:hypothetical protein
MNVVVDCWLALFFLQQWRTSSIRIVDDPSVKMTLKMKTKDERIGSWPIEKRRTVHGRWNIKRINKYTIMLTCK